MSLAQKMAAMTSEEKDRFFKKLYRFIVSCMQVAECEDVRNPNSRRARPNEVLHDCLCVLVLENKEPAEVLGCIDRLAEVNLESVRDDLTRRYKEALAELQ